MHLIFVFCTVIHSKQKMYVNICKPHLSVLPPNHFIHDARVALNDSGDLHGHIFSGIIRHRRTEAFRPLHPDSHLHRLKEGLCVDSGEYKAARVQCLGALSGGADADCREWLTDRQEETALLRQRSAVGDHRKGVHLQAVVIVEAQRLVGDHAAVQMEARRLQPLSASRVAGVKDWHVVLFRHGIDRCEQLDKIAVRIDVFLPVRREQNILSLGQTQTPVDWRAAPLPWGCLSQRCAPSAGRTPSDTGVRALNSRD